MDEGLLKGNTSYWTTYAYKYTFISLSSFLKDGFSSICCPSDFSCNFVSLFWEVLCFTCTHAHAFSRKGYRKGLDLHQNAMYSERNSKNIDSDVESREYSLKRHIYSIQQK